MKCRSTQLRAGIFRREESGALRLRWGIFEVSPEAGESADGGTCLVYVGHPEMERLVEAFFPKTIRNHLLDQVAAQLKVPKYRVWSSVDGPEAYKRLRRKTLYMGLSDGARLDALRHSNTGAI